MKLFAYIRRFGFMRGLRFYRVARKCDRDPHLLESWAIHYQSLASREFNHDNTVDGRAFLGFSEMLRTAYDQIVLNRKPHRPILSRQQRRIDKRLEQLKRKHQCS